MKQSLIGFDSQPRTRIVFGNGCARRAGELAAELGARRVLLVTDPGIVAAGHAQTVQQSLQVAGITVALFDRTRENPTTADVDACLAVAREAGIDAIVGLGGGSSMDTAKGCNFLLTNGGRMQDYWGVGKAAQQMLPLIAIPTTAGTGSECQSFALIADELTHQKMACGDWKAAARIALLDPALTLTQPRAITACTGMDAVVHAVESAVTRKRNEFSGLYSRESFRLTQRNLPRVLAEPHDIEARGGMLLGAAYAGLAIENSMLGAAHSAANPLTAHFGVPHGQAVGMMLPGVVRFNAQDADTRAIYAELALAAQLVSTQADAEEAVESLVGLIEQLLDQAGLPRTLSPAGLAAIGIDTLAREASAQWTAGFNPRAITEADFRTLYEAVLIPADRA